MSTSPLDGVETESGSGHEEPQHGHSHLEVESSEADPPPYSEEVHSSGQVVMDTHPPTQHASYQASESPSSVPDALEVAVVVEGTPEPSIPDPITGPQEMDPQLPTENAQLPSSVPALEVAVVVEGTDPTTGPQEMDPQLPTEHAQLPASPSSVTAPQRAVVVGGRIVWTESTEQDADCSIEAANALSHGHEGVDHSDTHPDKETEVISDIITSLYDEAQCSDLSEPYSTPCCELSPDVLCQKINCRNLFKTKHGTNLLLTDTLRRGRAKGWSMLTKIIFPLVPDTARDVWVTGEIATAVLGLLLSIVTVALRPNEPFGIVHLALATFFSTLVLIDGIFTLKDCTTCKKCYNIYKGDYHGPREHDPYFKCCTRTCLSWSKNGSDVIRVLASEMLLYPLVVCDIFKVITGRRFEEGGPHADRLGVVLLVLTTISLILYVYVARLLILVRTMKKVLAIRSPNYKLIANYYQLHQNHYDFSVRKSAFWYQFYLLIHIFLQMITQLLLLIAIGAKIFSDNQNLFDDSSTDRSVHFSAFLWYMIVVGFITPLFGLLISIFVTYHWTQEFSIGLCLDIVSIWKMGGPDDFLHVKDNLGDRQGLKVSRIIDRFLKIDELRVEFQELRQTHWCKKLVYPYTVPAVVITCFIYLAMQAVLVIYAAITIGNMGAQSDQILNEGGWVYFYILAVVVFAIITNAYSTAVASFWIMVAFSSIIILICTALNFSFSIVLVAILACHCGLKKLS